MNRNLAFVGKPGPHCWPVDEQEILDTIFYGSGRVFDEDKTLVPDGQEARKIAAQKMREAFARQMDMIILINLMPKC